ncbi:unnamed protein product [Trichobilharzia szidati]|nr:unnamed protein product [Trichobilharzia szidati]
MTEVKYRQLHHFSCGDLVNPDRCLLVSTCLHGVFVCASSSGLLLYDTKQYLEATGACELRRDKPLPNHKPNITISSIDPIYWTAFNSDGLTLAVLTSSENRGALVHLVSVHQLVKQASSDLLSISRSVRVCGGEPTGWRVRDFSWSPTDPTTFVVALESGAVRLFNFSSDASGSITLVGQLPSAADCRCVSWSPKGKQLALCLNGSLATANGVIQGPLILQVDPQMHQKRIVPLVNLFNSNNNWKDSCPVDILWTSSYNFLLAVKRPKSENRAYCSTQVLYISTTSKSPEPSAVTIDSLSSPHVEYNKAQYYFRFLGTNYVAVNWSYVGEEVVILQLPTTPDNNMPQALMSIELPVDGLPVSMDVGVFQKDNESMENSVVYLITCLSSGNICPYMLNSTSQMILLNPNLPKALNLQIPQPPVSTVVTLPSEMPKSVSVTSFPGNINNSTIFGQGKPALTPSFNLNISAQPSPVNTTTFSPQQLATAPIPSNTIKVSEEQKTSLFQIPAPTSITSDRRENLPPIVEQVETKEKPVSKCEQPSPNKSRDIPLPKSVQAAAAHFSSALKAEAEAGRAVWQNLFHILINGEVDGKSGESKGLDIIEARLCDVNRFLTAMDEVIAELSTALDERKEDLTNSVTFGERLRRALRLYASGDWFSTISGHLDPETNRLFSQLKRRARLAEAGLYDLEEQIESLASEVESIQSKNKNTNNTPIKQGKEKASLRNSVGGNPTIMRALDTNANLIRAERSRIDYIMENLKRLGLSPVKCESTNDTQCSKQSKSLNRSNISFSKDDDYNSTINNNIHNNNTPSQHLIHERDQALLRLFSNYKLPVIRPTKVCPSISTEAENLNLSDFKGGESFSETQPSSNILQSKATPSPGSLKNSRLEQLLVVSGELATNTAVSVAPRTPPNVSIKNVTDVRKSTGASPANSLASTSPLFSTPTSSILSKQSVSFGLTKGQSIESPLTTNTSTVKSSPLAGVKVSDTNTPTHQSLSDSTKPVTQSLFTPTTKAPISTTLATSSPNALAFTPSSKSVGFPSISTPSTVAASSTPSVMNNAGQPSPLFQQVQSSTPVTNITNVNSSGGLAVSTNSLFSSLAVTSKSNTTTPTSQAVNEINKTQPNVVPVIPGCNVSSPPSVSTSTSASTPGLFSFLPASVSNTGGLFGSGQNQSSTTSATTTTTSLFSSVPLTSTTSPASSGQTQSSISTTSKPSTQSIFGSSLFASAPVTGSNTFLFGTPSQNTASPASTSVGTVSSTPAVSSMGISTSKNELSAGTATSAPTSISSLFGATGGSTINTSGGLFSANISSLPQTSTSSTQPCTTGLFSFTNATISTSATTAVTTTSVTSSFSSPFGSSLFGKSPEQPKSLFSTPMSSTTTATAASTTATTTATNTSGLFGSLPNASTGGKLFGTLPTTQPGGLLFGSVSNQTSGPKLFETTTPTTNTSSNPVSSPTSSSTLFGGIFGSPSVTSSMNTANTTVTTAPSLFQGIGSSPTKSSGLFQFSSGNSLFGSTTANNATSPPGTGLFGAINTQQPATSNPPGAGLFGSPTGTPAKPTDGLFSMNSLNIGGNSAPQNPAQNVFGKAFGGQANSSSGLFGSLNPTSQTNVNNTPTASSVPQPGLFSNSLFGSSVFGSPVLANTVSTTSSTVSSGGGGGLFSGLSSNVNSGTGLFGTRTSPPAANTVGGFGSPPVFGGSPTFGGLGNTNPSGQGLFGTSGAAAFNTGTGGLFGAPMPPAGGGSLFGGNTNPPAGGGGLFASLANKTDNLSFGSLAQVSPPSGNVPNSPFGTSPSFTQRRA